VTVEDAVDGLARILFAFDTGTRTTNQVTASLTRAIVSWAIENGWSARTEARIEVPDHGSERRGFVDVIVALGADEPCLAIEIDSADKPWSLEKLRYAAAAGMRPVWVRWGDQDWAADHPDVDVIQLSAPRRPAAGHPDTQLGLWP
jgi:hypothetical protein